MRIESQSSFFISFHLPRDKFHSNIRGTFQILIEAVVLTREDVEFGIGGLLGVTDTVGVWYGTVACTMNHAEGTLEIGCGLIDWQGECGADVLGALHHLSFGRGAL